MELSADELLVEMLEPGQVSWLMQSMMLPIIILLSSADIESQ